MRYLISTFLFLFCITGYSQLKTSQSEYIHNVEKYIINKKSDSASYFINKLEQNKYSLILKKINEKSFVSYEDFNFFLTKVSNRQSLKYNLISNFIEENVKEPQNKKTINKSYVNIKWVQISKVRDEVSLSAASKVHKKLEKYINNFDAKDTDVLKAKTKITTHPIVMYNIEQDLTGKELCLKGIETARKLNDIELEVIFLYYLTDFLILEKKLQEYINVSEKTLKLINKLGNKSSFYHSTIEHLVDAYIYKGKSEERIIELLKILYNDPDSRIYSYAYYAKFLAKIQVKSPYKKTILQQFKVNNTLELTEKLKKLGKDLNHLDYQVLIGNSAEALVKNGFYEKGILYKNNQIQLIKNIYSKELPETLADFRTEQAIKIKQQEVDNEKEKTRLYLIIALLCFVLFLISFLVLYKLKKQSKELNDKNNLIKKSLREKELLVKEMHHRVKNNFQIISSLLELQIKEIEDEKALKLANEGKSRVKSMALIHQKLYQDKSGLIDFNEYLELLVSEMSSVYGAKMEVDINIEAKNLKFDVDTAIPLGLIINEIITNSYKYAFKPDKENSLHISIDKISKESYRLIIEDNGPGIPKNTEINKVKSLGLNLVTRLVKQLHGVVNLTSNNGTKFEITFKDLAARQLVD